MPKPVVVSAHRSIPVSHDEAMARVLPMPLESIFDRRYLALPAIREVRDQQGVWGSVGETRTIVLADGGTMQERLTEVSAPEWFGYTIGSITGPMKPLVSHLEGRWSFDPVGTGTRVGWAWTIHPSNAATAPVVALVGLMWRGYARRALEQVERNLLG